MISQLLWSFRLAGRGRDAGAPSQSAVSDRAPLEACPPPLGRLPAQPPAGLRDWLGSQWRDSTRVSTVATPHRAEHRPQRPGASLASVRADFTEALVGESGPAAAALLGRVLLAASTRELWHLRAEVYAVVARLHGEPEAQLRVRLLDRHFATRSASRRPVGDRSTAF